MVIYKILSNMQYCKFDGKNHYKLHRSDVRQCCALTLPYSPLLEVFPMHHVICSIHVENIENSVK